MAEKIVTVKTWEEFKQAMNTEINSGDTLTISITADLTDTEQHALPAPTKNYWATIEQIGSSIQDSHVKILGNGHTISGINIPDTYTYTALLLYNSKAGGYITIDVYNLKFINIKTPSIQVYESPKKSAYINLTNCVITGVFDFYKNINELHQCNIVQMSPRTQEIWLNNQGRYFIAYKLFNTHYYYTHLNNITDINTILAGRIDNSYIELNPGLTNLAEHITIGDSSALNQSCINCNKKLNFSLVTNKTTATGVTILNCTNDPAKDIPSAFANNIKIITDDQMKNADYLNSIGFTVTPTN